jgi:flagellin
MRIQHNIMAMNAYRNYNTNNSALSSNLEKLSSGYKINRAGDDAAGLAISEKMRAQISGLEQASNNVDDGISLVKTAEGALQEVQDMLNRMVELATQSANGTYDDSTDRANLQAEVDALRTEIDRIADSSNFNGINLLDGTQSNTIANVDSTGKILSDDEVAALQAAVNEVSTDTMVFDKDAVGATTVSSGVAPSAATKATITLTTGTLDGKFADLDTLKSTQVNGVALGALFDITTDGTNAASALQANTQYILVAKNGGALDNTTFEAVQALNSDTGDVTLDGAVNGVDEGTASAAQATGYEFTFDFSKIAGGQTFELGGTTFEFTADGNTSNGNTAIDISAVGTSVDDGARELALATAIHDALTDKFGSDFTISELPTDAQGMDTALNGDTKYTISMESNTPGLSGNLGQVHISQSAAATGAIVADYNIGTEAGAATPGQFASVTLTNFNVGNLQVGDTITIGDKTVTIGETTDLTGGTVALGASDAETAASISASFEAQGFDLGLVEIDADAKTLTVRDKTATDKTGADFSAAVGAITVTNGKYNDAVAANTAAQGAVDGISKQFVSGGLTLQIGDTSDDFNKLTVAISDMHASSLGSTTSTTYTDADGNTHTVKEVASGSSIADIDISDADGASAAIQIIKDAINQVSSTRGTLGAVQNRLEHTSNNLSVMTENIQDAESTIRDTDIAEEMMAYTKNNILVQSAQAMLAQANQVPQGVLQLLQ